MLLTDLWSHFSWEITTEKKLNQFNYSLQFACSWCAISRWILKSKRAESMAMQTNDWQYFPFKPISNLNYLSCYIISWDAPRTLSYVYLVFLVKLPKKIDVHVIIWNLPALWHRRSLVAPHYGNNKRLQRKGPHLITWVYITSSGET